MIKTAVIGCGFWGRLLIRSLAQQPDQYHLRYFCDIDSGRLDSLKIHYGYVNTTLDLDDVLRDHAVDAVVIATPIETHYEIARSCLLVGKHVMVEQPLAMNGIQCEELVELADRNRLVLLVDHIDQYNSALEQLSRLVCSDQLGQLRYLYAQRLNLGEQSSQSGVLSELASHELYVSLNLLRLNPVRISARGLRLLSQGVEDVVFVVVDFEGGVTLHIHAGWLDPNKIRKLTVVGSKQMIVYDDVSPDAKITIYDRKASLVEQDRDDVGDDSFGHFQLAVRTGDVIIPKVEFVEPLRLLCQEFAMCVQNHQTPQSDGHKALRVVQLLECARQSIEMSGVPVEVKVQG